MTTRETGYRVYAPMQPTLEAMAGQVRVLTCPCAVTLADFTAIPVYIPGADEPWGFVSERLRWHPCGTFGRYFAHRDGTLDADRIGEHLPADVAGQIRDWCEEFVRANPDTPMIPRTEVSYAFKNYVTSKTYLFTYNRLVQEYALNRQQFDPSLRQAQPQRNLDAGARASRDDRTPKRAHRQGSPTLDAFEGDRLHALFHGYSGEDRD